MLCLILFVVFLSDPFHEVKRKRDKKKEVCIPNFSYSSFPSANKESHIFSFINATSDFRRLAYNIILTLFQVTPFKAPVPIKPRKPTEQPVQEIKPNTYPERNPRRPGYNWNNAPGNLFFYILAFSYSS